LVFEEFTMAKKRPDYPPEYRQQMITCESFNSAIQIAQVQGSKMFELRATTSLASVAPGSDAQATARNRIRFRTALLAKLSQKRLSATRTLVVGCAVFFCFSGLALAQGLSTKAEPIRDVGKAHVFHVSHQHPIQPMLIGMPCIQQLTADHMVCLPGGAGGRSQPNPDPTMSRICPHKVRGHSRRQT
jgi:hypothetical protein